MMGGSAKEAARDVSEERIEIELNPRERRAYDSLRAKLTDSSGVARSGLRDYLLLLPDLTVLLFRLARDPRVPLRAKAIAVLGVGYVLSPLDLIPDFFGPVGLIDDLLIAVAALSRILHIVHPDLLRSHWSGKEDVLDVIRRVSAWAERQFKARFLRPRHPKP